MSHKFHILLLSGALLLGGVRAQTAAEQIGVTSISTTLQQVAAPTVKPPGVLPATTLQQTAPDQTTPGTGVNAVSTPSTAQAAPPPVSPAYQADLDAASRLLEAGSYAQARGAYERLVSQSYANPSAHFGLGLALFGLNDLAGARFEFTQLAALAPGSFEAPYNLGIVAARSGQDDEALAQFQRAAALSAGKVSVPVRRQVLDALAGQQAMKGDYAGLATTLTELTRAQPDDRGLQFRLAQAQVLSGQAAAALPGLYALRSADPGNADAALLTASIYAGQNLPDRAVRELDTAAAATPDPGARSRLLVRKAALLSSTRPRDAALAALEATQADSHNPDAWASLGALRAAAGDRAGALSAWQAAVRYAPDNALYRTNLSAVQLSLGQADAAARTARQATQLPGSAAGQGAVLARAQFVQGVAAYRQGSYAQARRSLASSALVASSAETQLWLGLSDYALKDYAGAATAFGESVRLQPGGPSSAAARLNLGSALIASGRYPEAETTLRALVLNDPKNADAWYQLGLSRRAQGREAEAQISFRTAASLGSAQARGALK